MHVVHDTYVSLWEESQNVDCQEENDGSVLIVFMKALMIDGWVRLCMVFGVFIVRL